MHAAEQILEQFQLADASGHSRSFQLALHFHGVSQLLGGYTNRVQSIREIQTAGVLDRRLERRGATPDLRSASRIAAAVASRRGRADGTRSRRRRSILPGVIAAASRATLEPLVPDRLPHARNGARRGDARGKSSSCKRSNVELPNRAECPRHPPDVAPSAVNGVRVQRLSQHRKRFPQPASGNARLVDRSDVAGLRRGHRFEERSAVGARQQGRRDGPYYCLT